MDKGELKIKNPELYKIAMEGGTERPFTGKYWNAHDDGIYYCAVCNNPLFKSDSKFDSGTGWPSFDDAIPGSIESRFDNSFGMHRTEVVCKKCGAHLGHLFSDQSETKTGKRYCINSVCLNLGKKNEK